MKNPGWLMAAVLALGLCPSLHAKPESVSGKVVYLLGFATSTWGVNGGITGRREDGTYWMVYTNSNLPESGTNRILTAASATTWGATAYIALVDHYAGNTDNYLYVTTANTQLMLELPQ